MFTGLVQTLGKVQSVRSIPEGKEISIESKEACQEVRPDDSVSVNGACQTVVSVKGNVFVVQAVHVTLEKTTLGQLRTGDEVNLELAMRLGDRLGGHLVQGHVNGTAKLISITPSGQNYRLRFKAQDELMRYVIDEGSVALEGISLTVSKVSNRQQGEFEVSIIPHTWKNTILKHRKIGDLLNVEVDVLAKYVENLLFYRGNHKNSGATPPTLADLLARPEGS